MTREEKDILFKDLCGRLPYHVRVKVWLEHGDTEEGPLDLQHNYGDVLLDAFYYKKIKKIKPYLRPMSSMTEKEYETFPIPYSFDSFSTWNNTILSNVVEGTQILIGIDEITEIIDWLNAHHFDFRNLIGKDLAIDCTNLNIY